MAYEALATESYVLGQIPAIVDNVTSTSTTSTLSANQGKVLNDRIDNLSNLGRYLALWDCSTGLPTTNPGTLPYTYKSGDYYRVGTTAPGYYSHTINFTGIDTNGNAFDVDFVLNNNDSTVYTLEHYLAIALYSAGYTGENKLAATGTLYTDPASTISYIAATDARPENITFYDSEGTVLGTYGIEGIPTVTDVVTGGTTNYQPSGNSYTGTASTTVETGSVATGDVYFYDGTNWSLLINHLGAFVEDVQVAGTSIVSSGVANITANNLPELSTDKITSGTFADARIASASTWNAKATKPFITSISLPTASWVGDASPYSQVITITGSTANSKIDLQPDNTVLALMLTAGTTAMYVANDNNVLTVYAIGKKPTADLTVQGTVTEVTQ